MIVSSGVTAPAAKSTSPNNERHLSVAASSDQALMRLTPNTIRGARSESTVEAPIAS